MITITKATDYDMVRGMLRSYSEAHGIDVTPEQFEQELETLDTYYEDLLVAMFGDRAAGCVAARRVDEDICEMKRLYVRPFLRRQGAGHALVQCLIETARGRGYSRLRMSAAAAMADAVRLCESFGFRDVEPFRENAPAGARFLELALLGDAMPIVALDDSAEFTLSGWDLDDHVDGT